MTPVALIVRQQVTPGLSYKEYREPLRSDFVWACAYCSIAELEANAINFEIDHYIPRAAGGTDDYGNLYWSCERCNGCKLSWTPNGSHPCAGLFILRIDMEDPRVHIERDPQHEGCVRALTSTGEYNIEMLDLNRWALRELRTRRARWQRSTDVTAHGLRVLARARLDELPKDIRREVARRRRALSRHAADLEHTALEMVKTLCHSRAIDPDPGRDERQRQRKRYLAEIPPAHHFARRGSNKRT